MWKRIATLILAAACALAQESPAKGPANRDPNANSSAPRTYQGCVIRSTGNIMLTDPSGHDYRLISERPLDSYVGQEVRIVASNLNSGDPSSAERSVESKPPGLPPALNVESVEKVSDRCSSPK